MHENCDFEFKNDWVLQILGPYVLIYDVTDIGTIYQSSYSLRKRQAKGTRIMKFIG